MWQVTFDFKLYSRLINIKSDILTLTNKLFTTTENNTYFEMTVTKTKRDRQGY